MNLKKRGRLTTRQRRALSLIDGRGVVSRLELANLLGTSPEGASQTAASLVRAGLIERGSKRGMGTVYKRPAGGHA
jgi:DNA-binding MarR family transcriptional regulator